MINFSNYINCKDDKDVLKEKYLNEDIFLVGTKIISGDKVGEIIRRGPNYVIALDENKKVFRSWITDIKEYVEEKPKRINKYRNYNNSRNNMDSVNSAAFFLGMLPEHSYKIRRAVERTILEGMDYDSAVETISEDLKSEFLVTKAIEYYDSVILEFQNPAQAAIVKAKQEAKQKIAAARMDAVKEKAEAARKKIQKSAQMKEEEELDELTISGRLQSYQKPGKRAKLKDAVKKIKSKMKSGDTPGWFKEDEEEIEESGSWLRRAKRERLNPNELRVQAQKGSRLARMLRQQKGLGEEQISEKKDPCWSTHTMVGTKEIDGKTYPNCVPKKGVKKAKGFKEELKGNQYKIAQAAEPEDVINDDDFKALRARKKAMKEQEQVGGVSSGFGFQGVYGASGKKYRKEEFSDWRNEISLSDNLSEKVIGNVKLNPKTTDCPECGESMSDKNYCPHCDESKLRTMYRHEESYEISEKKLTSAETKKKEEIVKSMKKGLAGFKKRYGKRAKEVMYATATKQAKKVAENIEVVQEEDKNKDRYYVFDKVKGVKLQSNMSKPSAEALYQRLIKGGRSSKEFAIRKERNK